MKMLLIQLLKPLFRFLSTYHYTGFVRTFWIMFIITSEFCWCIKCSKTLLSHLKFIRVFLHLPGSYLGPLTLAMPCFHCDFLNLLWLPGPLDYDHTLLPLLFHKPVLIQIYACGSFNGCDTSASPSVSPSSSSSNTLLPLWFRKPALIQIDACISFHVCDKVLTWAFLLVVVVLLLLNKDMQLQQLLLTKSNIFTWQLCLQDNFSPLIFPLYLYFFLFLKYLRNFSLIKIGSYSAESKELDSYRNCFSLSQIHLLDNHVYKKTSAL